MSLKVQIKKRNGGRVSEPCDQLGRSALRSHRCSCRCDLVRGPLPWHHLPPRNSGEHLVPWKVTTHCSQLSTGLWEVFVQVCLCMTSLGSFLFTDGETEAKVPNLVQAEVFTCQTYWNLELSNLLGTTLWPTGHSGACQRFFKVSTSCYTSPGERGQTFPPSVSYWYGMNSYVLHWFLRWAAVSLISFLHHLLGSLK